MEPQQDQQSPGQTSSGQVGSSNQPNQKSIDGIKRGSGTSSNNPADRLNTPGTQYNPSPLSGNDLSSREANTGSNSPSPEPQDSSNTSANNKSIAPSNLRQKEQESNSPAAQGSSPAHSAANSAANAVKAKVKSKVKKKAAFAIIGAGGGASGVLIAIILVFVASLVIPDFALHMVEWQFARLTLVQKEQDDEVTDEKLATEADPEGGDAIDSEIQSQDAADGVTGTDPLVSSMNEYSPSGELNKLDRENQFDTPFDITEKGSKVDIEDDGVIAPVEESGNFTTQDEEHADAIDAGSSTKAATDDKISTDLETESPVTDTIRDSLSEDLIRDDGGSLGGLDEDEYTGETEAQADATMTDEAYGAVESEANPEPGDLVSEDDASTTIDNDISSCVEDTSCLTQLSQDPASGNVPLPTDASDTLTQVGESSASDVGVSGLLKGLIDPLISVVLPICIIYDSSEVNSGNTVDSQDNEAKDTALLVDSAADQQKEGATNGTAVGALSWKIGQLNQTIAEQRAAGDNVSTDGAFQPQQPADGSDADSNILSALWGSGGLSGATQTALNNVCPIITNPAVIGTAVGLQLLQLAAGLFTGGATDAGDAAGETALEAGADAAAEAAAEDAAKEAADGVSNGIVSKILGVGKYIGKQAPTILAVSGLSLLARGYVVLKAGLGANGLEQGSDFANVADAGNNLLAGDLMRTQYYGRPLTNEETNQLKISSTGNITAINKSKSFYQRYFALDNSDSLVSNIVLDVGSDINMSSFSSFFSRIGSIFQPMGWLTSIFGFTKVSAAGVSDNPNVDNQNYGNIQWGWSQSELNLIESNPTYQPLENHLILADINTSANNYPVTKVEDTYEACFDSSVSLGHLLTPGWVYSESSQWPGPINPVTITTGTPPPPAAIVRITAPGTSSSSGYYDVQTSPSTLCSPSSLDQGASITVDNSKGTPESCWTASAFNNESFCNIIFRWRLDEAYQNMVNQQVDIQNAPTPTI